MGYDYGNGVADLYTSYNHSFYFYHYLDKKRGIRFIYGKRGRDVLPFLLNMRSALQASPAAYDNYCQVWEEVPLEKKIGPNKMSLGLDPWGNEKNGWSPTIGNALWFLERIIAACIRSPNAKWHGD